MELSDNLLLRNQHMRVDLAFGQNGLTVDLPEGFRYRVLEARSAVPIERPGGGYPAGTRRSHRQPALRELARGEPSAAISVCDITRPVPNRLILPAILSDLEAAGISWDKVTILIATGLHRPATPAEIREICGEDIAARYHIVNHNARALAEHRHLGSTASGTPVYIDERFVSAALHITVGFIEPHLMLGFSGGRKLIAPGLAAQETVKVLHSPKFMRDHHACEGSIDQNPLHLELLEIAGMARHDFLVDVALARGTGQRPIAAVFAGDPVQAHREGVRFVSQVMLETLDEPVDAVITTGAGYPLDLTFYQAIKGITAASQVVKPGGKILLMAACAEGAGGREFSKLLAERRSDGKFMEHILHSPVVVDQWQLEKLGLVTCNAEVLYHVPGLPHAFQGSLWGKSYPTADGAVQALTSALAPGATIAVIPEGPYVLARARA
jgi:lactate racemase